MLDVRRDHQTTQHLRLLDRLTLLSRVLATALLYLSSSYLTLFDASPRTVLAPPSRLSHPRYSDGMPSTSL